MEVAADKIAAQVANGLAPVYFVSGDDPLLCGEVLDVIRAAARKDGYEDRQLYSVDVKFDWNDLFASQGSMSLFAVQKILEINVVTGKPGTSGSKAIVQLLEDPPPDTLLIFRSPRVDKNMGKAKWVKALEASAVCVRVANPDAQQLPGWIAGRMRAAGLQFEQAAVELLAGRMEGNLMAAQQEIDKLALLAEDGMVTESLIEVSVADGARYTVYQLADAALGQDAARATRVLYGLRREGVPAPLVMWSLGDQVKKLMNVWAAVQQGMPVGKAMSQNGIWANKQPLMTTALRNHNEVSVRRLAGKVGLTDRIVKGRGAGQPWNALLELTLALAQPKNLQLAGYEP